MRRIRVAMVCLGNICRSPLMEALLVKAWAEHAARPQHLVLEVVSCGLNPMLDVCTQEAVLVGREHGVELSEHRSRQVDRELVAGCDLLLTATVGMKSSLLARFPDRAPGRTFSLGEFAGDPADIEDPYGRTMARYRDVAQQIRRYAEAVVVRLIEENR